MGIITVNGVTYTGKNVSVINDKVFIDGVEKHPTDNPPKIYITVEGDVNSIDVGQVQEFNMTGNAGSVKTSQGDINIKGTVNGDCKTSQGNITADIIIGDCKTSQGNIKYVKEEKK